MVRDWNKLERQYTEWLEENCKCDLEEGCICSELEEWLDELEAFRFEGVDEEDLAEMMA